MYKYIIVILFNNICLKLNIIIFIYLIYQITLQIYLYRYLKLLL